MLGLTGNQSSASAMDSLPLEALGPSLHDVHQASELLSDRLNLTLRLLHTKNNNHLSRRNQSRKIGKDNGLASCVKCDRPTKLLAHSFKIK
ncbi:hypothetical protein AVDCRST_MAG92-1544 [uncultured Coleofasciculus sp.]|uniref:Uncharacterized protein n=1 Tax=uncultured Coleofasciculus sp. TaxID=1267456 RepID=A0A6J4I4U9_9CYAN|nr:hypothetical protein AVDCRST_MAG92-1544 [uncultured Coleofasciculus sp.]